MLRCGHLWRLLPGPVGSEERDTEKGREAGILTRPTWKGRRNAARVCTGVLQAVCAGSERSLSPSPPQPRPTAGSAVPASASCCCPGLQVSADCAAEGKARGGVGIRGTGVLLDKLGDKQSSRTRREILRSGCLQLAPRWDRFGPLAKEVPRGTLGNQGATRRAKF